MPELHPANRNREKQENKQEDFFSNLPTLEPDERTEVERSGRRDQKISERHRLYGFRLPCVDIDFLLIEYGNYNTPMALIEYKHQCDDHRKWIKKSGVTATYILAKKAKLPFFVVFYDPSIWSFHVYPMDEMARKHLNQETLLTEQEFVSLLYRIRGHKTVTTKEKERVLSLNNCK